MGDSSSELLTRLNNKLGGWGLLDGSLTPQNWNGASFRDLKPFVLELCNPSSQLLDYLIQPTSSAYFPKLHLRAQERILAVLLETSPAQIEPVRTQVGALLDLHRVQYTTTTDGEEGVESKNELLSVTWLPRLAEAVAEAHGFSQGLNIIDQDAAMIMKLLPPTTPASAPSTEVLALQQPQDLQWQTWHEKNGSSAASSSSGGRPREVDIVPVTKHFAKIGMTRHYPYDMLIGGRHPEDIIKTYQIQIPLSVQQIMSTSSTGSDINFSQKARPKITFKGGRGGGSGSGSGNGSGGVPSGLSAAALAGRTGKHPAPTASNNEQRQQQAQAARDKAAAERVRKEDQVRANMAKVLSAGGGDGRKRTREAGETGRTAVSIGINVSQAVEDANKKHAHSSVSDQPASSPRNYDPSRHEKKFNDIMKMIQTNAPANRFGQIQKNNDFMRRLKDFATGAPELGGKVDPKSKLVKPTFNINLKVENGFLWALILNYNDGTFTIKKKKRIKTLKRAATK